jgi:prevent-host-death family protein
MPSPLRKRRGAAGLEAVPFSELRRRLAGVLDDCTRRGRRFMIHRHARPEAVLISSAEWQEISETLAVLSDPGLLRQIVRSERDIAAGRVRAARDVFADLLGPEAAGRGRGRRARGRAA